VKNSSILFFVLFFCSIGLILSGGAIPHKVECTRLACKTRGMGSVASFILQYNEFFSSAYLKEKSELADAYAQAFGMHAHIDALLKFGAKQREKHHQEIKRLLSKKRKTKRLMRACYEWEREYQAFWATFNPLKIKLSNIISYMSARIRLTSKVYIDLESFLIEKYDVAIKNLHAEAQRYLDGGVPSVWNADLERIIARFAWLTHYQTALFKRDDCGRLIIIGAQNRRRLRVLEEKVGEIAQLVGVS